MTEHYDRTDDRFEEDDDMIVKGALGFAISAAIGYTIKLEKKAEERIDERFDGKDDQDN
jgi:hypothetical protein